MSFLKGIFSKDREEKNKPATPQGRPSINAPPARPFPSFGDQQSAAPSVPSSSAAGGVTCSACTYLNESTAAKCAMCATQIQRGRTASNATMVQMPTQQHQQQYQQQAHAQPTQPTSGGGGGGDMFDLFDGMSLKVATPHSSDTPSNGHATVTTPAPSAATVTPASDEMDMFSGLTVASNDIPPATNEPAPTEGGSLLNMLNGSSESGDAAADNDSSSAGGPSGFSFMAEAGDGDGQPAAPEESAPSDGGSSFSFMSSSPDEPAPDEESASAIHSPVAVETASESTPVAAATRPNETNNTHSSYESPIVATTPLATPSASTASVSASTPAASGSTPSSGVLDLSSRPKTISTGSAAPTFEQTHSQIDSSLTQYWDDLKHLSLKQSAMRTQQIELQSSLKSSQDELQQLELQQQREIEAENYDAADQLNSQMDALKARITGVTNDLAASARGLSQQEENKCHLRRMARDLLEDALKQYQSLTKQYTFQMTNAITSETQLLEQKEDILLDSLEKTRRNLAHTLTDIETIEKEEEAIHARMEADTMEMTKEHDVLKDQLSVLESERAALRALLAAKEEEVAMCSQKIDVVVTSIAGKRSSHQKKLSRASEKKSRLQEEQLHSSDLEVDLLRQKAELEQDFHRVAAQEKGSTRKLKKMQEEVTYVQSIVAHKLATVSEKEDATNGASDSSVDTPDLSTLQQRLQLTLTQLDDTRTKLSVLESNIDSQTKVLDSVASRIPSLEAEKNLAVATRDFKKAASASKDVKALQSQKSELETLLASLREEGATLNASLTTLADTKGELQERLTELQGEADKKRLRTFLKQRMELGRKKKAVEQVRRKNQAEVDEAMAATQPTATSADDTPLSPVSQAVAANNLATATAHHFSFLTHELDAYSIEEELLSKEIASLRSSHGWSDDSGEDDARTEWLAERRARGEDTNDNVDADEDAKNSQQDEEESSISGQRRKERAAAAKAAQAEEDGGSSAPVEQVEPAVESTQSDMFDMLEVRSAEPASTPTATDGEVVDAPPQDDATDATSTNADEVNDAAPIESECAAIESSVDESAAVDDATVAAPVDPVETASPEAEAEAEADVSAAESPAEPEPSGPSDETIAGWRTAFDALTDEITQFESNINAAVEEEDFDLADELSTQLKSKRNDRALIQQEASQAGIQLSDPADTNEETS